MIVGSFGINRILKIPNLNSSMSCRTQCNRYCSNKHTQHPALWETFVSTTLAHSGATKAHDWMVSVLGPLFRTAGHTVRTQHGVTASAGQRRGDVEIRNYLQSPGREPESRV